MDHKHLSRQRRGRSIVAGAASALLAVGILAVSPASADIGDVEVPEGSWIDEFDSETLDPRWSITNESPDDWSLTDNPGSLTIDTLIGDTYQDNNSAQNIFLVDVPDGDFTAVTHVEAEVTAQYQGAGLIAWGDFDNYVRYGRTFVGSLLDDADIALETNLEVGGSFSGDLVPRDGSTGETMRIQRVGDTVTTSVWENSTWVEASSVEISFPITKVGLYGLASLEGSSMSATFDYFALEATAASVAADADALSLPTTTTTDLDLPTEGGFGSQIEWASSNPAVIDANGVVTQPASQNETVTLTATVSQGGEVTTRDFDITVIADDPQAELDYLAGTFELGQSVVWDDLTLVDSYEDATVSWASSDEAVLGTDGTVNRAADERDVTLTATLALEGATTDLQFDVTVLAEVAGELGSYIVDGNNDDTDSLHLALSDGGAFEALNDGSPVAYASEGSRRIGSPTLFHRPDGGYGLVGTLNSSSNQIFVFDTDNLIRYGNERLVQFAPAGHATTRVAVEYDNSIQAYRLHYTRTSDGLHFEVTTSDFSSFSDPVEVASAPVFAAGDYPDGALEADSIGITQAEYDYLAERLLDRVRSTSVDPFDPVTVTVGDDSALPGSAMVNYTSGNQVEMGVEWDDVPTTPGEHTVTGTVQAPFHSDTEEPDPLAWRRADPDVTIGDDGMYYLTGSYPTTNNSDPEGYDRVVLRRAETLEGLQDAAADEVVIWDESETTAHNRYIWAPELSKIGDDWYILVTTSRGNGNFDIRPAMLKYSGDELSGAAALDPANWEEIGYVQSFENDPNAFTSFSLDMSHFEHNGTDYLTWSEKPGASSIRMATIDPANPLQLTSTSILLTTPEYAWEINTGQGQRVNEGSAVVKHDGKVFVTFSSSTVDTAYNISVLWADEDADLMDPASWSKLGYPLLQTADVPGAFGPGHNSFTVDEFGNPVLVYHARSYDDPANPGEASDGGLNDPRRNAHAKLVHWDIDGMPILDMTPEEELDPAIADVSIQVTVEAPDVEFSDVDESLEHYGSIMWLASQGITQGWETENGTEFRPFNAITRDAMAAFLYRYAGSPEVTLPAQSPFVDADESLEHYEAIVWLAQEGVCRFA
ncbi:family 43 glycosylhydrolase [Demequina sp. SO4-13]|uniref:family 43 glycosylhydrolase n=1 Tax=Demequina sp. SO4-13 TaxID=3401027 RepID=UPI003AF75778